MIDQSDHDAAEDVLLPPDREELAACGLTTLAELAESQQRCASIKDEMARGINIMVDMDMHNHELTAVLRSLGMVYDRDLMACREIATGRLFPHEGSLQSANREGDDDVFLPAVDPAVITSTTSTKGSPPTPLSGTRYQVDPRLVVAVSPVAMVTREVPEYIVLS